MKIWEKNYLLTMSLLLALLFGSLFFMQQYSFRKNLDKYCDNAFLNESSAEYTISSYLNSSEGTGRIRNYCQRLQKQGIFLQIQAQGHILADSLPFPWEGAGEKDFQLVRRQGDAYLCIANAYADFHDGTVSIRYLEKINGLYQAQQEQMLLILGLAVLVSLLLSVILYGTMQKIYAPVRNIAHELRTPLTAIQGYAQFISLGNISSEDIQFASSQIDRQAQHLNALIENLLIMGSLREGEIVMGKIEPAELAESLKAYFPFLAVGGMDDETRTDKIFYGDKNLLLSLLRNLISNTCRQGEHISLSMDGNTIRIENKDDHIPQDLLPLLNGKQPIPRERLQGRGLGIPLCHEILKMHHGSIQYRNLEEGGVEILVSLWGE